MSAHQESTKDWRDTVPVSPSSVARGGMIFVFGFLGLFLLWATLFPLSSAVVGFGELVSVGENKLVQHQSGGVVRTIRVADGARVEQGDVLLELDDADDRASLTRLEARRGTLEAKRARLTGQAVLGLRGTQNSPALADLEVQQQRQGQAMQRGRRAAEDAARAQIASLQEDREGYLAQAGIGQALLDSARAELARLRPLARDGYVARNRLAELERIALERENVLSEIDARIASTSEKITEAEARLKMKLAEDRQEDSTELTAVLGELAEISDQIEAARGSLTSRQLRAPVSGTVTGLAAHTPGGVIAPGAVVAQIVPEGSSLEAQFDLPPANANSVHAGNKARVVVTAFNRRTVAPIAGEISYVAADTVMDETSGIASYPVRISLGADVPDGLRAGMTVEVYALGESRTFMGYALQPIFESFGRAFNEI